MRFIFLVFFSFFSLLAEARYVSNIKIMADTESLVRNQKTVGVSVAVLQNGSFSFFHSGEVSLRSGRIPDNHSVYEIGSITKVLTGLLLSEAVLEKQILLHQSIDSVLPRFKIPHGRVRISFLNLATHRSGLPRIYDSLFKPKDSLNPWGDFDVAALISFLNRTQLLSEPGTQSLYSNIGAALVGHGLEAIYQSSFERLLHQRIFQPAKMVSTSITYNPSQAARSTQGYLLTGGLFEPVPKWTMPGTQAAGAVHSTVEDLSRLVLYLMRSHSSLASAYQYSVLPHAVSPNGSPNSYSGLFWIVNKVPLFAWHNGATFGSSSFIAMDTKTQTAVIILANSTNPKRSEVTELGLELMSKLVSKL